MLYKLKQSITGTDMLEPVAFTDFAGIGAKEKDLEELLANNLLDVLFEQGGLLPFHQERSRQEEADIYALNANGDLVLFELKRELAGEGAVHQVLRYAQTAGQWSYARIEEKFRTYGRTNEELTSAHRSAFGLEHSLDAAAFNQKQHLFVIGSAADESLVTAIDYWKRQGLSIEFLPYRLYELGDERFFEFFALPYDLHRNPAHVKGVLFDTNRSWDENAIWYMIENQCVAAFGEAQRFVDYLRPGDIVFYSHGGVGLVAAARVKSTNTKSPDDDTRSRTIEFLTPVPQRDQPLKAMPFSQIQDITGKRFFWARTIKHPYLSMEEAENLVKQLNMYLG